jgi:hypothetical protein
MKAKSIATIIVAILVCSSCASRIDRQKFEPLYRAGKNIEGALGVGVNLKYRELLQGFATEFSIANDKAANEAERALVKRYEEALSAYKDAGTIWEKRLKGDVLAPAGDPELVRIVDAYPLSGSGSGTAFTFSGQAAVQTIWVTAGARLKAANEMYAGKSGDALPTPH